MDYYTKSTTGQTIEWLNVLGVDLLNIETFSSALLDEICRFIQRLLDQQIWSVTAYRHQHDVILSGGEKLHKEKLHKISKSS